MGQLRTKNLKEDKLHLRPYLMSDAAVIYENASKRVLEKAGFVQTEVKEAALNVNGEQFDQAIYEVMK